MEHSARRYMTSVDDFRTEMGHIEEFRRYEWRGVPAL